MTSIDSSPDNNQDWFDEKPNCSISLDMARHIEMIQGAEDTITIIREKVKKAAVGVAVGASVVKLAMCGLDIQASPEKVQERQDAFMQKIEHDGRYHVMNPNEGQVFKVPIENGTEILYEHDRDWEEYVSTVVRTDDEMIPVYVDMVIQYDGGPKTGKWIGIALTELNKHDELSEVIDDPTPQRSDGLVWFMSDSSNITSVPTEYTPYAIDETDE